MEFTLILEIMGQLLQKKEKYMAGKIIADFLG